MDLKMINKKELQKGLENCSNCKRKPTDFSKGNKANVYMYKVYVFTVNHTS
jgi:hypothetical protein